MIEEPDIRIFDTVAIVGVGLIGGSLGMAAKSRGLARRVIGIGRDERKLNRAVELGAIDSLCTSVEDGAASADLVIICTPVTLIAPTLRRMLDSLRQDVIVTDVGSTKCEVMEQAAAVLGSDRQFIGGHPMAGSEQAGVENAVANLFAGRTYVLTPSSSTSQESLDRLSRFVESMGAVVEIMDPRTHDRTVAIISHLPHVISAALLQQTGAARDDGASVDRLAAGSFRDLTRISDSPPEIWRDICLTNADQIVNAIAGFEHWIAEFKHALMECDESAILRFFEQARAVRAAGTWTRR